MQRASRSVFLSWPGVRRCTAVCGAVGVPAPAAVFVGVSLLHCWAAPFSPGGQLAPLVLAQGGAALLLCEFFVLLGLHREAGSSQLLRVQSAQRRIPPGPPEKQNLREAPREIHSPESVGTEAELSQDLPSARWAPENHGMVPVQVQTQEKWSSPDTVGPREKVLLPPLLCCLGRRGGGQSAPPWEVKEVLPLAVCLSVILSGAGRRP